MKGKSRRTHGLVASGRQLSLFADPQRERTLELIEALIVHGDKIHRLYDMSQKILLGVPGYARPEYVKRIRAHRKRLGPIIGCVAVRPNIRRQVFRAKPPRSIGTAIGTALSLKI